MGGGDLNLKKSWHPSTLRNIERVWKAEQQHEVEKQKIEQLQKELADERAREEIQNFAEDQGAVKKKEDRLDWMYQGPAAMVNRDEYLLGRKIDKTFETMQQMEKGNDKPKEEDAGVGSTMFSSQDLTGTATVDLANKIREDPLFSIMKKEKEERKNLLTNPVKMQQLQDLLEASLSKKKSKKSKKSKKKKHIENDSDEDVPKKKRKHLEKEQKDRSKHKRSSSIESDDSLKETRREHLIYHEVEERQYHKRSRDYDDKRTKCTESDYYEQTRGYERTREYDVSNSSRDHTKHKSNNSSSHKKDKSHKSSHKEYYSYNSHQERSTNGHSTYKTHESAVSRKDKRKIDSEEQERRLKEMQDNARWREEQLKKNTKRYKEEDEKEDKIKRVDSTDFLKPMLSKAASKGSLENRVKQKIFSIQRSGNAMDRNFAKRE